MVSVGRIHMKERILLVSSGGLDKSGVPAVLMGIVDGLSDKYIFDILLHTRNQDYFESRFSSLGGRIFRCPKRDFHFKPLNRIAEVFRPVRLYFFTRKILRKNSPYKVIHCCNDFDAAGCVAAAGKSIPIRICHSHKSWKPDSDMGVLTRLYRSRCRSVILRYATVLVGCSSNSASSTFGTQEKTKIVFSPYDETRFAPSLPLNNPKSISLLQVGYFAKNKNQLFSVEILKKIRETHHEASLTLIGDSSGDYGNQVLRAIEDNNLKDSVTLLPSDADIPAAMEKSSVLLFPSKGEGLGIVLIEAQAMGLHCFASDAVPGETNRGGVVFLPITEGPQLWVDAILSDNNIRMKEVRDCSCFSTKTFIDTMNSLYSV